MSRLSSASRLSDDDLLDATARAAADERHLTADLLALLAELDTRRLYLAQSCASLFTYCTAVLHFSEHAAYHRIEAARAARQFPVILEMIAEGALTLTTVALLKPHLTRDNHLDLLEAARYKSKRDVEHQMACLAPRPEQRSLVQRAPMSAPSARVETGPASPSGGSRTVDEVLPAPEKPAFELMPRRRAVVEPLSPERFLLKVTLTAEAHEKLRRAQELMRHIVPSGDPAVVIERALTLLVSDLERTKFAKASARTVGRAPDRSLRRGSEHSRHIPVSVRRAVWARDGGRCAFVGARGRCTATDWLEFHHVIPFADGGQTSVGNLALRCRAHNAYEALLWSPTEAGAERCPAQ